MVLETFLLCYFLLPNVDYYFCSKSSGGVGSLLVDESMDIHNYDKKDKKQRRPTPSISAQPQIRDKSSKKHNKKLEALSEDEDEVVLRRPPVKPPRTFSTLLVAPENHDTLSDGRSKSVIDLPMTLNDADNVAHDVTASSSASLLTNLDLSKLLRTKKSHSLAEQASQTSQTSQTSQQPTAVTSQKVENTSKMDKKSHSYSSSSSDDDESSNESKSKISNSSRFKVKANVPEGQVAVQEVQDRPRPDNQSNSLTGVEQPRADVLNVPKPQLNASDEYSKPLNNNDDNDKNVKSKNIKNPRAMANKKLTEEKQPEPNPERKPERRPERKPEKVEAMPNFRMAHAQTDEDLVDDLNLFSPDYKPPPPPPPTTTATTTNAVRVPNKKLISAAAQKKKRKEKAVPQTEPGKLSLEEEKILEEAAKKAEEQTREKVSISSTFYEPLFGTKLL